jgi:hypothetical protein
MFITAVLVVFVIVHLHRCDLPAPGVALERAVVLVGHCGGTEDDQVVPDANRVDVDYLAGLTSGSPRRGCRASHPAVAILKFTRTQ